MTLRHYRLLHVEDDPIDVRLFGMMLDDRAVKVRSIHRVATLEAAIGSLKTDAADVVFLDLDLPDSTGIDSLRRLLACGVPVPIVVLTGHADAELGMQAVASGAQDYLVKDEVNGDVLERVMGYAVERHRVQTEVPAVAAAYDGSIEGWARLLELRDHDTMGHSRRVADMAFDLAQRLDLPEAEAHQLRRGALLHDIGKIAVPDAILRKPGPLDAEERRTMEQHTVAARDLLEPIWFLRAALEVPYAHHERWDGSGYPCGLVGNQIPLSARIFAVVDVYDALTQDRPYRPALTHEDARAYVEGGAGTLFDPAVVAAFLELLG